MNLSQAILATFAYHDIFDYPLSLNDINRYLIHKKISSSAVEKTLKVLVKNKKVGEHKNFYFLRNRIQIVAKRIARAKYSAKKHQKAAYYIKLLKFIPTIKLLAITGALAMENSHKNDDIDFFIITKKSTLWTTRFFANITLWPFKRNPRGKDITNRACLNMFLDESTLKIKEHNIYTAHEICQMKVIWDKNHTYERFIKENAWVWQYLPNWGPEKVKSAKSKVQSQRQRKLITNHFRYFASANIAWHCISLITERSLRAFQLWYMKKKVTSEKIGDKQLFFHPANLQNEVISKFSNNLKKLGIAGTFSRDLP